MSEIYSPIDNCPTWAAGCGSGWTRCQGTPQIFSYVDASGKVPETVYGAYLWSQTYGNNVVNGEGMFTSYGFTALQNYDVIVDFSAIGATSTAPTSGTVFVYAANDLQQNVLTTCFTLLSNVTYSSKQLIGQFTVTASGTYHFVCPVFNATAGYSQLWIYPAANLTSDQFNLSVTGVYACTSCRGGPTYTQNTGLLPVAENAGDIYAGSSTGSGGSGIVGVQAAEATVLSATDAIYLLPSFQAVVTGTGSFIAQVAPPCTLPSYVGPIVLADKNDTLHHGVPPQIMDSLAGVAAGGHTPIVPASYQDLQDDKIRVYPTISKGSVTITGSSDDLSNADILVADESGRIVYRTHNALSSSLNLDLTNLNNGLYFLLLKSSSKNITQKIIIQR